MQRARALLLALDHLDQRGAHAAALGRGETLGGGLRWRRERQRLRERRDAVVNVGRREAAQMPRDQERGKTRLVLSVAEQTREKRGGRTAHAALIGAGVAHLSRGRCHDPRV